MSLVLRRRADGSLSVVGDPPERHTFATSFVQRGLDEGHVQVTVTVNTDKGPLTYALTGIGDEDGTANPTAWQAQRVTGSSNGAAQRKAR